LPPALAQFSCFFSLPDHAGLLEETATANFGQHSISLDLLFEAFQSTLEGLAFPDHYPRHMFPPLLVINFEITTNIIALAGSNVKFGSVALDLPLQFSVMVAHVRLDLWDECCQRARLGLFPDLQLPAALAHYGKRGYL